MTKREVLSNCWRTGAACRQGDLGSRSRHRECRTGGAAAAAELQLLAIERRGGGAALIEANAERLGVQPAAVLRRDALTALNTDLPPALACPDRVLLGGGGRDRRSAADLAATTEPRGDRGDPARHPGGPLDLRRVLETAGLTTGSANFRPERSAAGDAPDSANEPGPDPKRHEIYTITYRY